VGTHRIVRYFCSMLLRSKGGSHHTITKLTSKCILLHRITGIHHLSMRLVPNEESQIWKPNHHVTPKCILTGLAPNTFVHQMSWMCIGGSTDTDQIGPFFAAAEPNFLVQIIWVPSMVSCVCHGCYYNGQKGRHPPGAGGPNSGLQINISYIYWKSWPELNLSLFQY